MVNFYITKSKGYIVLDKKSGVEGIQLSNSLRKTVDILKFLESKNVKATSKLIDTLVTFNVKELNEVQNEFERVYAGLNGTPFRSVFATSSDIGDEKFTIVDLINQINHYCIRYGLGVVDFGVQTKENVNRTDIDEKGVANEDTLDKLNNTFTIIDVKTTDEFKKEIKTILETPIVFGENALELISEANKEGFLLDIVEDVDFKVKENLFNVINILGKENVKKINIFKTPTDVLRYAFFVSNLDYNYIEPSYFKVSTSDKKLILAVIDRMAKKNFSETYEEMNRKKQVWISLAQNIHPASQKYNRFSNAQKVFEYLRNKKTVVTYSNMLQNALNNRYYSIAIELLAKRPGELMRRLDLLIRNTSEDDFKLLLDIIKGIKLNPKLSMQMKSWVQFRMENDITDRFVKVKGKLVKYTKPLDKLDVKRGNEIRKVLNQVIANSFKGKELFETPNIIIEDEKEL